MNDPMTILKADHREVKAMLKTLAESDEGKARETLCEKVSTALTLHMTLEEELVYPLIKDRVGDEEDEEANVEHGLARDALAKMRELLNRPGFGAAVEMLARRNPPPRRRGRDGASSRTSSRHGPSRVARPR